MTLDRSTAPEPTQVRPFEFPRVERERLDNGLTVLSAQRSALPLVTVRAVLGAGAAAERAGEEGLAWLTAESLEGGTSQRSGEALAWELERLGAQLDVHVSWDAVNVSLTTRSDRLGQALELLAEIVRTPAFPDREIERLRGEQLAEMLQRSTEPRALGDDSAVKFIFGEGETYGRTVLGVQAVVRELDSQRARSFHARHYTPDTAAIVVVGAVDAATARREVERAFGDWAGRAEATEPPGTAPRHENTTIHIVDRASAVQSEVRIGHVGVPRHHPDYYPIIVMNAILGGAFTSRLNLNLREKHGFTYGVRSTFAFRRAAGPFVVQTAVASDVTARAVEESLHEMRAIRDDGVSVEEVSNARDYLGGTLPLTMQTTEQLAGRVAELHTFDLPIDHFERFGEELRTVTAEDVQRVAREQIRLDRLAIVVVGNGDDVESDLRALGLGDIHRHAGAADHTADSDGSATDGAAAGADAAAGA